MYHTLKNKILKLTIQNSAKTLWQTFLHWILLPRPKTFADGSEDKFSNCWVNVQKNI